MDWYLAIFLVSGRWKSENQKPLTRPLLIIVADQMVVIIGGQYLANNRASRIAHENRGHSGRDRSTVQSLPCMGVVRCSISYGFGRRAGFNDGHTRW